jgi:hypothetical protein
MMKHRQNDLIFYGVVIVMIVLIGSCLFLPNEYYVQPPSKEIQHKKVAYVCRGYHTLNDKTYGDTLSRPYVKDYYFMRDISDNFKETIYDPLCKIYGNDIDFYFVSYEAKDRKNFVSELTTKMPKFKCHLLQQDPEYTSVMLIRDGIKWVSSQKTYDRIILARNDMMYKKPINEWLPEYSPDTFWYLFKEIPEGNTERMGENLHIIDGDVKKLISILSVCIYYRANLEHYKNMHSITPFLRDAFTNVVPVLDKHYDTNTVHSHEHSNNPIYWLGSRKCDFIPRQQ